MAIINSTPIAAPSQVADTGGANRTSAAQAARERAISKLVPQAQEHPVSNPTQVAAEELSAIKSPTASVEGLSSAAEAPAADPAKVETPAPAKDEPALSSQYAVLARKEKQFRQKVAAEQASLKAERDALEKIKADYAAKDAEYQTKYIPKARLTEDTINVLLEAGISHDQIAEMALTQGSAHQDPVLKAQLAKLEAQIKAQADAVEESKKAAIEAQSAQYQEALKQITHEATNLVARDPNFEAIKETGSVKEVVNLIEKTFKEDGILMTVEDAAKEVEAELMERLSNYAQKIKKLQQKFQPKEAPKSSEVQATPSQSQPATKTLTNAMGAARPLSAKERAVLAFQGKLNK